ncbi:rhodanese-like domain-containing protein 6 [Phragmites australis]|uniref:rhodanese-like domain-containing protein 6 n=1 Tax=Phragmites australis TaxID=29695 RepID=UPI002D79A6D2|nr:rhodanese-like domain-containing protein 6 [Phragmites australis]
MCLHGFRTSGEIMRRQVTGRWPPEVTSRLDLVFADAPFPAEGASPVAGVFDPPYYEWCQFVSEDFLKCRNFDRRFSYVEELMAREGPFDGLLGFSQGAGLSAVLSGLRQQGLALTGVAKVKYVIQIAGAMIQSPAAATRAFAGKIVCPSLHFIDEKGLQVMLRYLDTIERELSVYLSTVPLGTRKLAYEV